MGTKIVYREGQSIPIAQCFVFGQHWLYHGNYGFPPYTNTMPLNGLNCSTGSIYSITHACKPYCKQYNHPAHLRLLIHCQSCDACKNGVNSDNQTTTDIAFWWFHSFSVTAIAMAMQPGEMSSSRRVCIIIIMPISASSQYPSINIWKFPI